jgi:hypothetical protein
MSLLKLVEITNNEINAQVEQVNESVLFENILNENTKQFMELIHKLTEDHNNNVITTDEYYRLIEAGYMDSIGKGFNAAKNIAKDIVKNTMGIGKEVTPPLPPITQRLVDDLDGRIKKLKDERKIKPNTAGRNELENLQMERQRLIFQARQEAAKEKNAS